MSEIKNQEKVHTCVSLQQKQIKKLYDHAQKLNITNDELMILLLRYAIRKKARTRAQTLNLRVQYQERLKDYATLNLYVTQRDYEVFITARRFFKYSVSWLLGYALEHFLSEVITTIKKNLSKSNKILNIYLDLHTYSVKKRNKKFKFRATIRPYT